MSESDVLMRDDVLVNVKVRTRTPSPDKRRTQLRQNVSVTTEKADRDEVVVSMPGGLNDIKPLPQVYRPVTRANCTGSKQKKV